MRSSGVKATHSWCAITKSFLNDNNGNITYGNQSIQYNDHSTTYVHGNTRAEVKTAIF